MDYWDKEADEGHGDNRRLKGNAVGPYIIPCNEEGVKGTESNPENIVGPASKQVTTTINNTIATYAGTDTAPVCIGSVVNLTDAMRKAGGTGTITSITLHDSNNIKAPVRLLLFNSEPENGVYTNNTAPDYNGDKPNHMIQLNNSDYLPLGDGCVMADIAGLGRLATGDSNGDLHALLLAVGSATYTVADALTLGIDFFRD